MGVKIEPSFDTLKSGALRGRLMVNGVSLSYTSKRIGVNPDGTKKYESKSTVKQKICKMYDEAMHRETVSKKWRVEEWLLYWMNNYKKPSDFYEVKERSEKGGKVNANSYMRLDCTYRNQIRGTEAGKLLLRKELANVLPNDIRILLNELEEKKLSYSTVKKAYNLLGEAFAVAVENKYMPMNPCRSLKYKCSVSNRNKVKEGGVLSKEQIENLFIEALREGESGNAVYDYGAGVALQLATGCRSGELRALSWDDIENNKIHIKHSVSWVKDADENGKLSGRSHPHISMTKSDAGVRSIPYEEGDIIDLCLKCLQRRCRKIECDKNLVMPTSKGGYLTPNKYNKTVNRIIDAVCSEHMSSHALRHTFISYLVNDERCEIASVASIVGHGDISVTLRYASHTNMEKKKNTMRSVSSLYNKEEMLG